MSPPRRALLQLALVSLGIAISWLLLEIVVLAVFGEQVKFPRHVVDGGFGVRINEPHAVYRHKSPDITAWFRINGQGMRADREFAYEKPADTLRIVSLGDSFTIGYEVDLEDSFSHILERELRASGVRVEVLNAGVSGYSNAEAAIYLERELLRYAPDLVLLSFYENDLDDNVRTGLFRLEDGRLVRGVDSYIPAGRLGNFLNTNGFFNFLSERSNAFAFLKERITLLLKSRGSDGAAAVEAPSDEAAPPPDAIVPDGAGDDAPRQRLAAAIIDHIYAITREQEIPFVIQSIPRRRLHPERLTDVFPSEHFDVDRPGLLFVSAKEFLDPWIGRERIWWDRSHWHWTPFSHHLSGKTLADAILERGLLTPAQAP